MIKAHITYLRKIITIAATIRSSSTMMEEIGGIRCSKTLIYQMMRDIVCDARFYSVVENELFWKNYSCAVITHFIDSLTPLDWENEEQRTLKKEDFLNEWLAKHIFPLTASEQRKIESEMKLNRMPLASGTTENGFVTPEGEIFLGNGITDMSGTNEEIGDNLPAEVQSFQSGHSSNLQGAYATPHNAEAVFLNRIDPTVLELAMSIGRKGSVRQERNGKFQTASRSDISGISTGDNLNSLLPIELAILANPSTEKVFLHRYVQKRLQVFSSTSTSSEERKEKAGPIFICVDTSGSMKGQPEQIAKTLALAISIVAQRDKRPLCIVNYSHELSFFILTDLSGQRNQFLSFLSKSYDGGNNENKLFRFLFETLPQIPRYRRFANAFKGADMLVVSDFVWSSIVPEVKRLITDARNGGMKFHALMVNYQRIHHDYSDEESYMSGYHFFSDCDQKYVTDNYQVFKYEDKA